MDKEPTDNLANNEEVGSLAGESSGINNAATVASITSVTAFADTTPVDSDDPTLTSHDPVSQMEEAAKLAEDDAKDIEHVHKMATAHRPALMTTKDPNEAPVDVRQDFIDRMHNPKKSKQAGNGGLGVGQKVAIIVAAILVVGVAGFFAWWFGYYNQPKVVLADALKKISVSDSINTGMTWRSTSTVGDSETTSELILTSQSHGSAEFSQFLAFNLNTKDTDNTEGNDGDESGEASGFGLTAELRTLGDGILYTKLGGLDGFNAEYDDAVGEASEILDQINDKWYRIKVDDILDFLGVDQETSQPILDFYQCSLTAAKQNNSEELAAMYKDHPFLSIAKSGQDALVQGATSYELSIDYQNLADFLNSLSSLSVVDSVNTCYNMMAKSLGVEEISSEDYPEVSADDLEEELSKQLYLVEISNFGHELARLTVVDGSEDANVGDTTWEMSIDFDYSYQSITAPEEYYTAEDFITAIQEYIGSLFTLGSGVDDDIQGDVDYNSGWEDEGPVDDWYDDEGWYFGEDL